jgi:phenylalanyl-tRNA synthetase beta chain
MPVINMPLDLLLRLVNQRGQAIDESRVPQTLHDMGVEVEELTSTHAYACGVCGNVIDRTDAQGPPTACARCGADYREKPGALRDTGRSSVARLDMLAVRPDIFDPGGMARYMRGFLGVQPGLIEYPVRPHRLAVRVDSRLARDDSFRPFIACAVLRSVRFDHERIRLIMNLQEDLHWALGRDRKLASIGVYDLDTLDESAGAFVYEAVVPDGVRFVPLGYSPGDAGARMTPAEILAKHKTGQAYAHLLAAFKAYPLLRDGRGNVLSLPPIINSEATRVTMQTRQCFVDVTGLSRRTVDRTLNVLVTSLREVMPELEIEAVLIDAPDGKHTTPDLTPASMRLDVRTAAATIGVELDRAALAGLLERMGHGVSPDGADALRVRVPAWRNDVMHPVDLIEDAAIALGYQNLAPRLVPTFTVGTPRVIEEQTAIARRVMVGLGFHQVMTLPLTSEKAAFERWRLAPDSRAVRIENPISVEQTLCRVSLLPGLLETLSINKQYDLPQLLFEAGDCCFVDEQVETGAREERTLAAAMIGTHIGYADIRAVADAFTHEMGAPLRVRAAEHASFIPGRIAELLDERGGVIGVMGELHPEVLERYGLRHAVAVMELSLAKLT